MRQRAGKVAQLQPPEPAMFDADHLDRLVMHTILVAFIIGLYPW